MNIGDYIRSKYGIAKIIKETNDGYWCDGRIIFSSSYTSAKQNYLRKSSIKQYNIKSSPNIIDLIKKKDILVDYADNIYKVVKVWKDYVFTDKKNEYGQTITLVDYQIKSIVTHEMFESMEYKIGE